MHGHTWARSGVRRRFTLLELMVVIGIIMVMMALAIPSISKFLDGQSLSQSGRIVQSAFNEARRAAITQRARNYLVFFRQADPSRPGNFLYGMRRFRERVGYEGEPQFLLSSVAFDIVGGTGGGLPAGAIGQIKGCAIPVFDELPEETNAVLFGNNRRPVTGGNLGWLEFRRDGTIRATGSALDKPQPAQHPDLFDVNTVLELNQQQFDDVAAAGSADPRGGLVDMNLREAGEHDVDKRCFLDIDFNTGRVNLRVLQVAAQ